MRIALLVFVACVSGCSAASSQAVDDFPIESDSGSDAGAQTAPDSAIAAAAPDAGEAVDSSADAADARYGKYGYGPYCSTVIGTQCNTGYSQCQPGLTMIVCAEIGLQNPAPAYAGCTPVGYKECETNQMQPVLCCTN